MDKITSPRFPLLNEERDLRVRLESYL